jgi:hypothetical protein
MQLLFERTDLLFDMNVALHSSHTKLRRKGRYMKQSVKTAVGNQIECEITWDSFHTERLHRSLCLGGQQKDFIVLQI